MRLRTQVVCSLSSASASTHRAGRRGGSFARGGDNHANDANHSDDSHWQNGDNADAAGQYGDGNSSSAHSPNRADLGATDVRPYLGAG